MKKLLNKTLKIVIYCLINIAAITTLKRTGEYNVTSYLVAIACVLLCAIVSSLLD